MFFSEGPKIEEKIDNYLWKKDDRYAQSVGICDKVYEGKSVRELTSTRELQKNNMLAFVRSS